MAKSKVIVFKNATNWAGFNLKTRCLVRTFIFIIISTWCVYHVAHYVLQLVSLLSPKGPKLVFQHQTLGPKSFLRFDYFIGIN